MERRDEWDQPGAHATTPATRPQQFIRQYLLPLFFRKTVKGQAVDQYIDISSEEQFWKNSSRLALRRVCLLGFRLSDWFPRVPGVFWSERAHRARTYVLSRGSNHDPVLGEYYSPQSKMGLIEDGGIGTIRLRPRQIDASTCWLGTALTGTVCHAGIPVAIPNAILQESGVGWGETVRIEGEVRFLQDVGLEDTATAVHHVRPLVVLVHNLRGAKSKHSSKDPILIAPVSMFAVPGRESKIYYDDGPQYTFVQCAAGSDGELDAAAEWIDAYAAKHEGRVITNFDEQRPLLADAPLSYQRLVNRTYERTIIRDLDRTINIERVDHLIQTQHVGDVHMAHNVNVGGSAIVNIDSSLNNVTQAIGAASGLDAKQKSRLDELVRPLRTDLGKLQSTHPEEAKEIAAALEKAVTSAIRSPRDRKKNVLALSAKGLKEAAKLVKDVMPNILTSATALSKFITGLG